MTKPQTFDPLRQPGAGLQCTIEPGQFASPPAGQFDDHRFGAADRVGQFAAALSGKHIQ